MGAQCSEAIDVITHKLGFSCQHSPPVIHLSNPFGLANWTLPVLELLIVAGAVFALWWAVQRLRRHGDPVNLVLWCATVIYLLIVEPPLYFPDVFGVGDMIGSVFAHNIFTVQFLYDRLPLYIVALYPAMAMLAYEIVRSLGIFRDRGVVLGAICVGLVHQCFYEVFDQLGPQLLWWAWNTDSAVNRPMLASVPMSSVLLFATVGPALLTCLVLVLVGRPVEGGRQIGPGGLILRTFACAVPIPVGLAVANIPITAAGGDDPDSVLRWAVYLAYLAVIAVTALWVLVTQVLRLRNSSAPAADRPNPFVRIFGTAYLAVLVALWLSALPDHLGGSGGVSAAGTPTGNLPYAAVCLTLAALLTATVSVNGATSMPQRHDEASDRAVMP